MEKQNQNGIIYYTIDADSEFHGNGYVEDCIIECNECREIIPIGTGTIENTTFFCCEKCYENAKIVFNANDDGVLYDMADCPNASEICENFDECSAYENINPGDEDGCINCSDCERYTNYVYDKIKSKGYVYDDMRVAFIYLPRIAELM